MLMCLTFCGISSAQRSIDLSTLQETKGVKETISTRDIVEMSDGIVVTYNFTTIRLQDDPIYNGATLVNIDGFWPNCNDGEPSTLSRMDTFIVPNKCTKVVVMDSAFVEFPMELSPARPVFHNKVPHIDAGTLYIQNETLTSSAYYEAKTIKVGKSVTSTQTQGDVNFLQGNHKLIGNQIELQSGTTISTGATVEIKNN